MDFGDLLSAVNKASNLVNLYLLCSSLLVLKIMGLIVLTVITRIKNKAFICDEDAKFFNGEVKIHDDVERIRRAVQNDLENILPFIVISYFYLFTNPPSWLAHLLFIVFLIVRILHSVVYAVVVSPQPTRAILWGIGFFITGLMSLSIAIHAIRNLI